MRAFVTGSTGLLGNNLIRLLRAAGHEVTALVRDPAKAEAQLGGLSVQYVRGDLQDVAAFAPALAGHDLLFHTAAYFREYYQPGDHWATLKAINIDGTVALLRAAEQHGVSKVIYTSSSGVIGARPDGKPADETVPADAEVFSNLYFRSKLLADQAVDAFMATSALPVVFIQPGWMFGPGDAAPTSAGQLVRDFIGRKLPAVPPGHAQPVDARDVAQGMINAVERGKSGERYLIAGPGVIRIGELTALLERVSGVPAPRLHIPYPAALALAYVSETASRLTGQPTLITISGIKTLRYPRPNDSSKAIRALGVSFRPLEETLRDTVAWYRARAGTERGTLAPVR